MLQRYHKCDITGGKLVLGNRDRFTAACSTLPEGKYLLTLTKLSDRNIRESQKYYFAILTELSRHTGEEKMDLHEMIKADVLHGMFPSRKKLTTTKLDEDQWDMFIMNVAFWAFRNYEFTV